MGKILEGLPYDSEGRITVDAHFTLSLDEALRLYCKSRKEALGVLYKSKELARSRPPEIEADYEEVAASCGYFSFCLQDFANEMKTYLEILDELKLEVEERPNGRSWTWLKFWQYLFQQKHDRDPGTECPVPSNEDISADLNRA